ncbi:MAG: class I SAM-dependent methyltransferase [Geminicoccaceae bacterium]
MTALDWGSGNGHFSYFLLRLGLKVAAFNLESQPNALADKLIALYEARYRLHVGPSDQPVMLPFADRSFDLVFSIGVLEHVRETGGSELASLAEIRRVLRPGGRLICGMLPKRYSWIEFLVRNLFPGKHHHVHRYTRPDVERLLAQSGFHLVEIHTHGFLPRNSLNAGILANYTNRRLVAKAFNGVDRALARILGPVAQNVMFCAERSATP